MEMTEWSYKALFLGLLMTVVLGAANAYLGLRAGITIAATYPAAVIAMAAVRAWKGSILEENISRTAGSIGESVAAGAISRCLRSCSPKLGHRSGRATPIGNRPH